MKITENIVKTILDEKEIEVDKNSLKAMTLLLSNKEKEMDKFVKVEKEKAEQLFKIEIENATNKKDTKIKNAETTILKDSVYDLAKSLGFSKRQKIKNEETSKEDLKNVEVEKVETKLIEDVESKNDEPIYDPSLREEINEENNFFSSQRFFKGDE